MSFKFIDAVQYMQMPMIPKAVINSLANFADENGRAFPSIPTLAACICCSIRSVGNGLEWLRKQNLITQVTGKGGNNIYYLHPENFTGEYEYPANFKASPMQEMHPCTTFTPASPAYTHAPHADHPCISCIEPMQDVPTNHHNNHHNNHHITVNESSGIYAPEIEQNLHQEIESVTTEKLIEPKPKPKAKPKAKNKSIQSEFDAKKIDLPANIIRETWIEFVQMRTKTKKPLTEFACKLLFKRLAEFKNDPNKSLENSIIGNWSNVFEVKNANQQQQANKWDVLKTSSNNFERDVTPSKKSNEYLEYGHA